MVVRGNHSFGAKILQIITSLIIFTSPTVAFRRPHRNLESAAVYSTLFLVPSSPLLKIGLRMTTAAGSASALSSFTGNAVTSFAESDLNQAERKIAALFGMYVGDATAMPVHWMYNLHQLQRDYGKIRGYVKPRDNFDGSIMNLSNTGGGGRGSDEGEIIGSVINHNKKKYWVRGGNFHYHLGLDAGENTLEAQLTRLLTKGIINRGEFNLDGWLQDYIQFMTTPGSHNDTYASTCHRMFFANHVRGKPPRQCADNDGHNVDAIDALTNLIPVIIHYADSPRDERNAKLAETLHATRKSRVLEPYAENFADILVDVMNGEDLRSAIEKYGPKNIRKAVETSRSDPMVACYIDSSYPALLYFAYKYADSAEDAVLASANAGGENVARGSCLGALVGAAHGLRGFPAWTRELKNGDSILQEIHQLVALHHPEVAGATSSSSGEEAPHK